MPDSAPFVSLAPLHGVTGRVFREAFFAFFPGFDEAVAPFIPATLSASADEKQFRDLLPLEGGPVPVVPQLLCNDGAAFASTSARLAAAGYSEVNWNLGCPYPMVANKKRGSGLLPHPDLIDRILAEALPLCPIPVSVKIRLGRNSAEELGPLMAVLNRYPLSRVIAHPRVGVQMYEGRVDLDGFSAAAAACRHPIAYNGDIRSAADYRALKARFPSVGSWMIGRGALADPFLAGDLKGLPRPADELPLVKAFHDELYLSYVDRLSGPRHALDKLKEVWSFLGSSFLESERVWKLINRAKTPGEYAEAVERVFGEESWRPAR